MQYVLQSFEQSHNPVDHSLRGGIELSQFILLWARPAVLFTRLTSSALSLLMFFVFT
jgi:hypothetical protein